MPLVDYLIQPGEMITPDAADRKRKLAQALMLRGTDTSPVQHWTQGAARLSDALFGALEDKKVDRQESDAKKDASGLEGSLFASLGGGGSAPAPSPSGGVVGALGGGAGGPLNGTFDDAVNRVLKYEGGYTVDNGGPTNFGISSRANPDVNVRSLTPDGAKAIYKQRYWDAIGGDELAARDPRLAFVAFDTAVNAGPGTAQKLLAQSGGDPQKMLALRQQYNTGLIERDPSQYGKYADGWNNRLADIGRTIGQQPQPTQMAQADAPAPGAQEAQFQIPGQPQEAGVAVQQAIKLLNNPYTSPAAKMIAQQMVARAMKAQAGGDDTANITEYNLARKEGYKGNFQQWLTERGSNRGQEEFGLNAVWGTDENGKPALFQLSNRGGPPRKVDLQGFTPSQGIRTVDTGTGTQVIGGRTGEPVREIPKDLAGAAAATAQGQAQGQATANLPAALRQVDTFLTQIDDVRKDPYRERGTGFSSVFNSLPATGGYDFGKKVDQLKGQSFLQAYNAIKGTGSISEAEGAKAEAAIARLDTAQSEGAFSKALDDVEREVRALRDLAYTKAGQTPPAAPGMSGAQPTKPQSGGYPEGTVISNGKQKMIRRNGKWEPM